jgi:hypothetical protein
MSLRNTYEQKYLKYKSKYLTLKNKMSSKNVANDNVMNDNVMNDNVMNDNVMIGGSKNNNIQRHDILNINELSITPTMMEVYGYVVPNTQLKGGMYDEHKEDDIKKLSELLDNSESALSKLSSEMSEVKRSLDSESHVKSVKDESSSSTTCSKSGSSSCSESESDEMAKKEESDKDMDGGMKKNHKKHHKKHFFDDSDLDINSTTESYLSSLESSDSI